MTCVSVCVIVVSAGNTTVPLTTYLVDTVVPSVESVITSPMSEQA
jgi:hypothetical protein